MTPLADAAEPECLRTLAAPAGAAAAAPDPGPATAPGKAESLACVALLQ